MLWIAGLGGVVIAAIAARSVLTNHQQWVLEILIGIWVPLWITAARAGMASSHRLVGKSILVIVLLIRIVSVSGIFSISDDAFRYAWDGQVQASAIDPYRYPPRAVELTSLHDDWLWPDPGQCLRLYKKPVCTRINRPSVRTIYPAVAEAWFVVVHLADPGAQEWIWQTAAAVVDLITVLLISRALRLLGRDPRLIVWYGLCPLPVLEFVNNAHIDGLALAFMIAAVLALERGRPVAAGALAGAATMVKLYPAVLVLAFWRQGRTKMALAWAAVVVGTEAPHVVIVGRRFLGYLPGYLREEHYESGARFLLFDFPGLPTKLVTALAAFVVILAWWAVLRRARPAPTTAAALLGSLLVVTSTVQPWYAVCLVGLGLLVDSTWWAVIGMAAEPYYASVVLHDAHQVAIGRLSYGTATVVIFLAMWRRRADRDFGGTLRISTQKTALLADKTAFDPADGKSGQGAR